MSRIRRLLDVARLRRRQLVVEYRHVDLVLGAIGRYLLQLARADVYARRGLRQTLRETTHRDDIGRLGQKLQFAEKLFGLLDALSVAYDGHYHSAHAFVARGIGRRRYVVIAVYHPQGLLSSVRNSLLRETGRGSELHMCIYKKVSRKNCTRGILYIH